MCVDRREFLRLSAGFAGASMLAGGEAQAVQVPESYRQQFAFFARDRAARIDSRPSPARLYDAALQTLSRAVLDAVPGARLGAILGIAAVESRLRQNAGRQNRHAVLAFASLRAHHFLAQLPS